MQEFRDMGETYNGPTIWVSCGTHSISLNSCTIVAVMHETFLL